MGSDKTACLPHSLLETDSLISTSLIAGDRRSQGPPPDLADRPNKEESGGKHRVTWIQDPIFGSSPLVELKSSLIVEF